MRWAPQCSSPLQPLVPWSYGPRPLRTEGLTQVGRVRWGGMTIQEAASGRREERALRETSEAPAPILALPLTHAMTLGASWPLSALQCPHQTGNWAWLRCGAGHVGSQVGYTWFIFMDLHTLEKPLGPCRSLLPPPRLGAPDMKGK